MGKIIWSNEAELWMESIYNYISQDNPAAASRIVQEIYDHVQKLSIFPKLGYIYPHRTQQDVRILQYKCYKIAHVIKGNSNIEIVGVYHDARDLQQYLK